MFSGNNGFFVGFLYNYNTTVDGSGSKSREIAENSWTVLAIGHDVWT